MKALLTVLLLAAPAVQAEIYRCDGPQGPVYADKPCSEQAEVVTVDEASSGISMGPSEEVRDYLASQREERASEREERQRMQAARPAAPVTVPVYESEGYPVYWPNAGYPNRPIRPRPPRPGPEPPIVDGPGPGNGGSLVRPRR